MTRDKSGNAETSTARTPGLAVDGYTLRVRDLTVEFHTRQGVGRAVNGVSFDIRPGETLGLVGESGSGKSVTASAIIGLHPKPAARIIKGTIEFEGKDLVSLSEADLRAIRGDKIGLIPQDPMTSLNPVFSVERQIDETLRLHTNLRSRGERRQRAIDLLTLLHISSPAQRLDAYPHQLSGGMRQRVVGSVVLGGEPSLIIADEPTTSLDATVQAAYLELLKEIQAETGTAILFITHDFGVVADLCDRVAVMYAGRIVETAPTRQIFDQPEHPYTQALIASVPDFETVRARLPTIEGKPPSIYDIGKGCPFVPRCPHARTECREEFPPRRDIKVDHEVACWLHV